MAHTIVVARGTQAIRAIFIALVVTALVLGAIALAVWAWPDTNEGTVRAGLGSYAAGNPPVMGDVHYTAPTLAGFGGYEPGSPPTMHDPQARILI